MSKQRFPEEFKAEAVKQITERGHKVSEVAARLGVSQHTCISGSRRAERPLVSAKPSCRKPRSYVA
jgi:transposase-like protein